MSGAARDAPWRWYAVVALTALLGSLASLGNRFAQDDIPVIVENARLHSLASLWHRFAESYWPPEVAAVLYRPVTTTAFTIQWVLGDGSPWPYHFVSILLLICIAGLVLACLRQLLPAAAAGIAALLFAAHPVHVESVGNVSGQSELWAAGFVLAAVLLYLQARMRGETPGVRRWVSIVVLGALAVFSKEHGAVLIGLLLAVECTVAADPPGLRARLRMLWPGYVALALTVAGYVAARAAVLGSVVGEVAHIVLRDAGLWQRVLTMLAVVPEWLRLLLVPAHLQSDYMPQEISLATGVGPDQLLGALLLVATIWVAWRARRPAPAVTLALLWIAIALFPVSNLVVSTGVLLAERTLFLPSVGAVLLLGGALTWWRRVARPLSFRAAVVVTGLIALLVVAGTLRSAFRQSIWRDNPTLFAQAVEDAPLSYTAHWAQAGVLWRSGLQRQAELHYRMALRLYDRDANLYEDFGDRFIEHGLCIQAAQFMRQALAEMPGKWKARSKLIFCLLSLDSLPAAQGELTLKRERGEPDVALVAQVVDSVLRSHPQAAP